MKPRRFCRPAATEREASQTRHARDLTARGVAQRHIDSLLPTTITLSGQKSAQTDGDRLFEVHPTDECKGLRDNAGSMDKV